MVAAEIATVLSGLKAASEIVKGLTLAKSESERQAKSQELQNAINTVLLNVAMAQSEQSSIVEENKALKEQIVCMKNWQEEKKRYKLVCLYDSTLLYALIKAKCNGEIAHYICKSCYENNKKSILNAVPDAKDNRGRIVYACPSCKEKAATDMNGVGAPKYAEELAVN